MLLLSTLIHLIFAGVIFLFPVLSSNKKIIYTPVYKVNLVSLPQIKKALTPAKKKPHRETLTETKPVNLLSGQKKNDALAKLKTLEKDLIKEEQLDEMEESDIPEMIAALDKMKAENESGLLDDSEETRDNILDELNKLEKELSEEKDNLLETEKIENLKSLEQLKEMEKKWEEQSAGLQPFPETDIDEALEKLVGTSTPVSSQNLTEIPSYLSLYFALIQNTVKGKWKNPSGIEILSETETSKKTIISFNIIRSGRIEDYEIQESSGNHALDSSALVAVKNSDPLPPLPSTYNENFLRVFIDFNYSLK